MLSDRAEAILKTIVGQYITKAKPVASQSLINDYEMRVSSATIRNDMALRDTKLPSTEQRLIHHLFHQVEREMEEWLKLTANLTARLAQNMAIVTTPKSTKCRFKRVELISLQDKMALLILILEGAKIKQQLITFQDAVSQPRLTATANRLNDTCSELTGDDIAKAMDKDDKDKEANPSAAQRQVAECLIKSMHAEQENEEMFFNGLHFMLNQPEFAGTQQVLPLMEMVDHHNLLNIISPQGLSSYEVRVVIGKENKAEAIKDYSIVISRYGIPGEAAGTIGIIGPTRMPYARAISSISYLSSLLSGLVAELYGKEKEPSKTS